MFVMPAGGRIFSGTGRHTRSLRDWSSDVCSSDLGGGEIEEATRLALGDWCWARGVELAIEHNVPFKLHTGHHAGTGYMPIDWVRAGNLCPLLARYPEARSEERRVGKEWRGRGSRR